MMQNKKFDKYYNEAMSYYMGEEKGYILNYKKAEELFKKSGEEFNNSDAYYTLGVLYERFDDTINANKSFESAAKLGHGYSQYKIGEIWLKGKNNKYVNEKEILKTAYRWYILSLSNGVYLQSRISDLEKKLTRNEIDECQNNPEIVMSTYVSHLNA